MNLGLIIGGLICISVAIWGKKFGAADVEGFPINEGKEVSTWSGKLVFGAVGIGFLVIGVLRLLGRG